MTCKWCTSEAGLRVTCIDGRGHSGVLRGVVDVASGGHVGRVTWDV